MTKRGLIIGDYDTAVEQWTLTAWSFSDPAMDTNFVEVPGRKNGPLDLSTSLTDGDPVYSSRTLTATFECSEGDYLSREARISDMMNRLDGMRLEIVLPDDLTRHIVGRVSVGKVYNNLAHGSVRVTAVCEPWRYNDTETRVVLVASSTAKTGTLPNQGRLAVAPEVTVTGGDISLVADGASWVLSPGVYTLPDLILYRGGRKITYSGAGTATFVYREGIL